jgi:hypothetical protein
MKQKNTVPVLKQKISVKTYGTGMKQNYGTGIKTKNTVPVLKQKNTVPVLKQKIQYRYSKLRHQLSKQIVVPVPESKLCFDIDI